MELMNSEKESETPRTDASLNTHSMINRQKWCDKCGGFVESIYAGNPMFCRCDPKVDHINKLEADVAKLNHQLLKTENDLLQSQDINSFLDVEFRIACKRAEKAEAEVERLKEQLESTKLLALKFWNVLEENGFKIELPK
jgi:hypothetical protein